MNSQRQRGGRNWLASVKQVGVNQLNIMLNVCKTIFIKINDSPISQQARRMHSDEQDYTVHQIIKTLDMQDKLKRLSPPCMCGKG